MFPSMADAVKWMDEDHKASLRAQATLLSGEADPE
jgi:hypothetical protein